MKTMLSAISVIAGLAQGTNAETIGVTMQNFDDNFQTLLRNGMSERAAATGVKLQIEDAQRDVAKQLNQVNNFIAAGVDGIVVTLADSATAPAISEAAKAAYMPLVYVNLEPSNLDTLPEGQAYVGSNELEAGRLGGEEACRMLKAAGKTESNGFVLIGDLAHTAAIKRSAAAKDALTANGCDFVKIVGEQVAAWSRTQPDVVFANNDEMAIGAAQAMRNAGVALAKGAPVERVVNIPFELVTGANMAEYGGRN